MRYLVAFDIADDKRRYRVVKVLLGVGRRVQQSVFEVDELSEARLRQVMAEVRRLVDTGADSVRAYALCGTCVGKVETLGVGQAKPARRAEEFVVY